VFGRVPLAAELNVGQYVPLIYHRSHPFYNGAGDVLDGQLVAGP
jgi:hypothetical protein